MGKIKTHKASAKRFSVTASGKVKLKHQNHRHKLGHKSTKVKRNHRRCGILSPSMAPAIKTLINAK